MIEAVEITTFKLVRGCSGDKFIAANAEIDAWLKGQPGFRSRRREPGAKVGPTGPLPTKGHALKIASCAPSNVPSTVERVPALAEAMRDKPPMRHPCRYIASI